MTRLKRLKKKKNLRKLEKAKNEEKTVPCWFGVERGPRLTWVSFWVADPCENEGTHSHSPSPFHRSLSHSKKL